MKWYNIKEYYPPISTECLIRTINSMFYVARCESIETPDTWLCNFYCEDCENSNYEKIYNVTHFSIIEPVAIP